MSIVWADVAFDQYGISEKGWQNVPGVYIFTKLDHVINRYFAIYVGQTESFAKRLIDHERLNEAIGLGASYIHAAIMYDRANRLRVERELITKYNPPLNHV